MNQITTQLEEIGLSKNEAKVYIGLLEKNNSSVLELSKRVGIKRTTVYDHINSLIVKGLVNHSFDEFGKKYYYARNPNNLKSLIEEKYKRVEELIPKLKQISGESRNIPKVEILPYAKALEKFTEYQFSRSVKAIKAIGDPRFQKVLSNFPWKYEKGLGVSNRRVKQGIWSYILASEKILDPIYQEYYNQKENKERLRKVKYLDGLDKLENTFLLAKDYLLLLPPEDEEYGILIKSDSYVKSFEKLFEYYWDMAKEL